MKIEWEVRSIKGGVMVIHVPCQMYRTVHDAQWVGILHEVMESHKCRVVAESKPDGQ